MSTDSAEQGKFTGKHMAMIMVAFFAVIIAVNLTMATLANRTWTGLVVKNSYVASQQFNDKLKAARVQAALGLRGSLFKQDGGVGFKLEGPKGAIVGVESLTAIFKRPATENLDKNVDFTITGHGEYFVSVDLGEGTWTAEIVASGPKLPAWQMSYRIFIGKNGEFSTVTNQAEAEK